MGILNLTPDSFSDGGKFMDARAATDHALKLAADGADIIDMGAESTRPGSIGVSAREQLKRLLPALKAFRAQSALPVSIDTRSAHVAQACLAAGANMINDISALRHDPKMAGVCATSGCDVILMHMRGTPRTMQRAPRYSNIVAEVRAFFAKRISACARAGIAPERILLDPGIGFGKTVEHNLVLLKNLPRLAELQRPLVVGVSRKMFLGTLTGEPVPERRVIASVIAGFAAVRNGAAILRVHDVAEHAAARKVLDALCQD